MARLPNRARADVQGVQRRRLVAARADRVFPGLTGCTNFLTERPGVRYSFHGKVRATGQQVDGYVEAETSTEAIDRLADQGIIGVYSVRAEPKQPRNAVLVAGTPEFERALYEQPEPGGKRRRALPAPAAPVHMLPPMVPLPAAPAEPAPAAVAAAPGVSDSAMLQLVDKLTILIGQMQKMLDRPAQVIYASGGPAREGKGGGGKRAPRAINDAQNSTLRDIFQNNLDLRRSLQKLADTVTPVEATPKLDGTPVAAAGDASAGDASAGDTSAPSEASTVAEVDATGSADVGEGPDLSMHVVDAAHDRQAQPAA